MSLSSIDRNLWVTQVGKAAAYSLLHSPLSILADGEHSSMGYTKQVVLNG